MDKPAAGTGSFAAAARQLEVSVPSVHKLIGALERELGVTLFERSARGLSLTGSGSLYLECCEPLLAELQALEQTLQQHVLQPGGTLVVAAHPQLVHHFLMPAMPRFLAGCPEVQLDVRVIHRLDDPDAAVAEVYLLHGWPEAPDMVHRHLGLARTCIVASPAYWAAHEVPRHPAELAQHHCLAMRNPAGILIDLWEFEREGQKSSVAVRGWLNSNDREVLLGALLDGAGVGRVNALTTRQHLQQGQLVPVLQDWQVLGGPPLNLLYRAQQRHTPSVRLFVDFVTALAAEAELAGSPGLPGGPPDRPCWHRRGYARASAVLRWRS